MDSYYKGGYDCKAAPARGPDDYGFRHDSRLPGAIERISIATAQGIARLVQDAVPPVSPDAMQDVLQDVSHDASLRVVHAIYFPAAILHTTEFHLSPTVPACRVGIRALVLAE